MSDQKPANESGRQPADKEIRSFPFEVEEYREKSENGRSDAFIIRGHAAVFDTWTDLGYFREKVAKGAFDDVLSRDPHVLHVINHDMSKVLSSTRNKTLELRTDPKGLHMYSKVAPTSYAADLKVLMERKDVDQSSFAFTVAEDDWHIRGEGDDEVVERTILKVGELYDVTTTAMGAYPTTDSQVAARTLERAQELAKELPQPTAEEETELAAPQEAEDRTDAPLSDEAASEEATAAQGNPAARARADLLVLKKSAKERTEALREAQWQVLKEM